MKTEVEIWFGVFGDFHAVSDSIIPLIMVGAIPTFLNTFAKLCIVSVLIAQASDWLQFY